MNTVIKQIRAELRNTVASTINVSHQIHTLKWKEGSLPEVKRIRSERNPQNQRINGKRALKPFRRPETGDERNRLWTEKRDLGAEAREYMLLYAMLRGRAYATVEVKCKPHNEPGIYGMHHTLSKYFEGECPIGEDALKEWVDGGAAPQLIEAAA